MSLLDAITQAVVLATVDSRWIGDYLAVRLSVFVIEELGTNLSFEQATLLQGILLFHWTGDLYTLDFKAIQSSLTFQISQAFFVFLDFTQNR